MLNLPAYPFGHETDLKKLRLLAKEFCKQTYTDISEVNINSGEPILLNMSGVKHTLFGAQHTLIHSLAVLPEVLRNSIKTPSYLIKKADQILSKSMSIRLSFSKAAMFIHA